MTKQVLIICYSFPPYPGIGGRRWAKFAKYLSRLDYTVHVIHAKNPFDEESLWLKDVAEDKNIKRYELRSLYPSALLIHPKSLIQKLHYKFALFFVKLLTNGSIYDRSVFFNKKMLGLSKKLIQEQNIKNIIVSGPPFNYAFYALELEKKFEGLNLMIDFRDPWTWDMLHGFSTINKDRLIIEKMREAEVVKNVETVFVPTDDLKLYIDSAYPSFSKKVKLLPHAFDKDEIVRAPKKKSEKIKVLLYGSIYDYVGPAFAAIAGLIRDANEKICLDIYSNSERYKEYFEEFNLNKREVNYHPPLSSLKLFDKINSVDYILIVQPHYAKDAITTKIYEIIYSETPIILISDKGRLFSFISENKLGLCFTPENLSKNLDIILRSKPSDFELDQFPIDHYSFENVTSNLILNFK